MRLWWITTALLLFIYFGCFFGESECTEEKPTSSENKVTIRRRVLRRKLDLASSETSKENATVSVRVSTSDSGEDTSLPKSTTFVQARRALFNRLNRPLLKNRSLDTTISKLRSRLGAVDSTTTKKPRFLKKVIKKQSPISIQVPTEAPTTTNDSMIMIPVPASQRKPYQPVIMQVTKSNESSTAAPPETKVVTYKLNKMFVPMGIYGKVVGDVNTTSEETLNKGPEIRHKGTQSESSEKSTGIKVSDSEEDNQQQKWEHLLKEIKSKGKKNSRNPKEHSRIADTIDITYNYSPKYDEISLTTQKTDPSKISLTTDRPEFAPNSLDNENRRVGNHHQSQSSMTRMAPPTGKKPTTQAQGPLAYLDTLKQTVSNIPGLFHKGLTSLTSLTSSYNENPFQDDTFTSASEIKQSVLKPGPIVGAIPGGFIPTKKPAQKLPINTQSDYETLEYFRNRPYLFGRQQQKFFKEPKSISGFKPVTAPAHMAQEYFGSTPTTPGPSRQTDSSWASSASQETHLASPSSWRTSSAEGEISSVPTEEDTFSWRDYLLQSSEYGTQPGSKSSWRDFLGLAPSIQSSSMMSSTFGNTPMMLEGGRRSMTLDDQWKQITSKYTMKEINEARTKIHKMFAGGPSSRSYEETGGGAFNDLLKMFQLWFNVGTGRSVGPMKNYEHIKSDSKQRFSSEESWKPVSKANGKPLISFSAGVSFPTKLPSPTTRGSHYNASPRPYIPYNMGLSNHITTLAHNYAGPTKSYSESSKYASYSGQEGGFPSSSYDDDGSSGGYLSGSEVHDDTYSVGDTYSPAGDTYSSAGDTYSPDSSHSYSPTAQESTLSLTKTPPPTHTTHHSLSDLTLSDPLKTSASTTTYTTSEGTSFSRNEDDDSPYELVPSEVYFNQKNPNLGEIAAVIKPAGVSDEVVKAHLPPQVAGIPTLNYPSHLLPKNPQQGFNSLNQLQEYLSTGETTKTPSALSLSHKQRAQLYKVKEASFMLPQKFYDAKYSQDAKKQGVLPQQITTIKYQQSPYLQGQQFQQVQQGQLQQIVQQQQQQLFQAQQQQQQLIQAQNQHQQQQILKNPQNKPLLAHYTQQQNQGIIQQNRLKSSGDSSVGFSDFELPSNLDPDIAALLKAELDKDDVPDEIRKEFQEAKREEEEKARKEQAIQQASSSIISSRLSPATPPAKQQTLTTPSNNRRSDTTLQQHTLQQMRPSPLNHHHHRQPPPLPTYPLFHFNQNQRQLTQPFPFQSTHTGHTYLRRPPPPRRTPQQVVSKFFAPIPINPTVMSQTLKGRYQSPVPRYVVELAKKLQRDRDVQGIVRVSTKRGHGPPVEYLYPVRG